ncbi:CheR family methyltransferase [Azospirillum thermophilum]|uniref:Chemotaxis protein methyltransferase n=1 Tax=Azospirillum thermophilum TaxID=2202148 RepID=A0A2S2CSB0_9PROT|nr:protein-glutamate O-methyltransferase [Azospirillum thermophilum]AWK87413.1 chemotaxis protein [Azospirillum thermophilum]
MDDAPPASARPSPRDLPGSGRREFPFHRRHFDLIARMLYQLAGIALAPHKVEMVYSRLARRLRDLRLPDFDSYCALLEGEDGAAEVGYLVNALTTNLTSFYREAHHFEFLAHHALPEFRARNARSHIHPGPHPGSPAPHPTRPRLRIWSAGCSSGPEPYTIAMVLASTLGAELPHWDARILATDIDTHMVETARRGVYPAEMTSGIPPAVRDRFTHRTRDRGEPAVAMDDALRRLITFKPLNLLEPWPMKGPFDAIFCRNVLIYFDRPGRMKVIDQFARMLPPDRYLFLGHSESLYGVSSRFRQVGPTIYQRV